MGTGATVVFDQAVRVTANPEFIDRCRRVADILNERAQGFISIKLFGLHPLGNPGRLRLYAEVAWRNEIFAVLSDGRPGNQDYGKNHAGLRGTSPGPFDRERTLHEDNLPGELAVILCAHLNRILKDHEERVHHARQTLPFLQRVSLRK